MNDDVEQRLERARLEGQRVKETEEFLKSLGPNDEIIKPVYSPEAFVARDKFRAAAARGELPKKDCRHPLSRLQQYQDDDPSVKRRGNDVNLFICTICETHCWLIDPWGVPISDT